MRGNPPHPWHPEITEGPIPAHAGESCRICVQPLAPWAYPRACGGIEVRQALAYLRQGLSPRMRGNRGRLDLDAMRCGPIPAHAGESVRSCRRTNQCRAYPRACGGIVRAKRSKALQKGLSPRMRGNPLRSLGICDRWRPIPAHAGNQVYRPRANGAKGPIPAHAGESKETLTHSGAVRAYPRACGGIGIGNDALFSDQGLSPRMRGNQWARASTGRRWGPIPAHAGESR